jgi:malic enzyme
MFNDIGMKMFDLSETNNSFVTQLRTATSAISILTSSRRKKSEKARFHNITCVDMKHKITNGSQKNHRSQHKRKKKKKKRKLWSEADMERAIDMVVRLGMSCRGAAKTCNVSRSTLWVRLKKEKNFSSIDMEDEEL